MGNPILNDRNLQAAARAGGPAAAGAGWGAPTPGWAPPISDGPATPYATKAMTLRGTVEAAGVLFALLLVGGIAGWAIGGASMGLWLGAVLVGFVLALVMRSKPHLARFLAPVYAVIQGVFVGAVSRAYESAYNGIVLQAVGATVAVTGVMFALYHTRILKVTDRYRRIVMGATLGLMVFYGISMVLSLFHMTPPFIHSASPFGILFSIFAAGLAASNLALDFDVIERGTANRLPAYMEWYAAFGLLVTVVWLYLELLRLLAKLQRR